MSNPIPPHIIRTERGLTIAGTRITLYDMLGYLHAGWPAQRIQDALPLTDAQLRAALDYLAEHREAIEEEYQQVLQAAAEARAYWETRNRERLAHITTSASTPDVERIQAKLAEHRARRAREQHQPTSP